MNDVMEDSVQAGIIVIGDEILIGLRADTNSNWIARRLNENGMAVRRIAVVGDDIDEIKGALSAAQSDCSIAILTGGLGPTSDDLTRQAIAEYFQTRLEFNGGIYRRLRDRLKGRGIKLSEGIKKQAEFPVGAEEIHNANGDAPGIFMRKGDFYCFALPGVPREMQGMVVDFILPKLKEEGLAHFLPYKVFRTVGLPEIQLSDMIGDWDISGTELAFLPTYLGVDIRVTIRAGFSGEADELLDRAGRRLQRSIGEAIFGYDEDELASVIGRVLAKRGWRITTAESCTGGLLGKMITDVPGSSRYFQRGFITYSNKSKVEMLGVEETLIDEYGAVSAEVAAAMAEGAANWAKADFALAITGIAGPAGGTESKPVGTVYIAVLHPKGLEVAKHRFFDDRELNRFRSAKTALIMLFNILKRQYSMSTFSV